MGAMRKLVALFLFCACAAAFGADPAAEFGKAELARERRRLASDVRALADVSRRLETALSQLTAASRAVADGASRTDVGPDEILRREDAVEGSEQEVRSLLERRRLLADRLVERRRSIAALEADLQARKPPDVLSGRWTVTVEPGEQRGIFQMKLEGTLVSGDFTLEGGYSGSLRGTLISDRLRIERVDSRLGFSTVYFGRVARDGNSIAGTWESTALGGGAPGSGRWRAVREAEKEETQ
jgi:hypothetical protein